VKAVLDAGALVAVDKGDRRVGAMLRVLQRRKIPLSTSAAVVGQVWRDGARQAALARVLAGVGVCALDADHGKLAGELQAAAKRADVVDAHVALLASAGDQVLTSDPRDIRHLLEARRVMAHVVKT
jgi:hypothetical protein